MSRHLVGIKSPVFPWKKSGRKKKKKLSEFICLQQNWSQAVLKVDADGHLSINLPLPWLTFTAVLATEPCRFSEAAPSQQSVRVFRCWCLQLLVLEKTLS